MNREAYLVEFAGWEAKVRAEFHSQFTDTLKTKSAKVAAKHRLDQIPEMRRFIVDVWFALTERWGVTIREFPPTDAQCGEARKACVEPNPYVRNNGLELLRRKGACALGKGYTLEAAILEWLGVPRNWTETIQDTARSFGISTPVTPTIF